MTTKSRVKSNHLYMPEANMPNKNNYVPGSVSSALVRLFLRTAQDYGVTPAKAIKNCNISDGVLDSSLARIETTEFIELIRWLINATNDDAFGMRCARHVMPGAFGLLGYMILNCHTSGDALRMVPRYETLIGNLGYTRLTENEDFFAIHWHCTCTDPLVRPHLVDEYMASTVEYARWVTGRPDIAPIKLYLERSRPTVDVMRCYRELFQCNIEFDANENYLEFSSELLNLPINQPDAVLLKTLEEQADKMQQELMETDTVVTLVRSALLNMMETTIPRRERVAAKLGMSERTLQRRLLEADSSYQQILDELRLQQAKDWLVTKDWGIAVIATRLGFTEPRSFQRRFKSWTGTSPGEFRRTRCRKQVSRSL